MVLGCPHDEIDGPHDAFHTIVNFCKVSALVQQGDEKVRLLDLLTNRMVSGQAVVENSKLALETHTQFHGKFSKFGQPHMTGCQRTHCDVRHHTYRHALLENLSNHLPNI